MQPKARARVATALAVAGSLVLTSCLVAGSLASVAYDQGPRTELGRQAAAAARADDCETANARIDQLRARQGGTIRDPGVLNDEMIQRCLGEPRRATPAGWFCTSSPALTDLCFCAQVEAECRDRQQRLAEMGALMSDCVPVATPTCAVR